MHPSIEEITNSFTQKQKTELTREEKIKEIKSLGIEIKKAQVIANELKKQTKQNDKGYIKIVAIDRILNEIVNGKEKLF